jgi:hypothetical protein
VVVSEAVDGMHEVRPLPKWLDSVGADPDLQGELDRAHRGRPTGSRKVPSKRSRKQNGSRADQWRVDDLEVFVADGEWVCSPDLAPLWRVVLT